MLLTKIKKTFQDFFLFIFLRKGIKKQPIRTAKRKQNLKNEGSVRSLWDNLKCTNIASWGCCKERRESKILETYLKKMRDNFPNLVKEIDIQVQEARRVQNKMNPQRPTPRHIIIKMQKVKDL